MFIFISLNVFNGPQVAGANDGWPSQFRFAGVRFSSVMAQLRMLGHMRAAVVIFGFRHDAIAVFTARFAGHRWDDSRVIEAVVVAGRELLSSAAVFAFHFGCEVIAHLEGYVFYFHGFVRLLTLWPNKTLEPTAVGAVSSAIAVHAASRRWLSFFR